MSNCLSCASNTNVKYDDYKSDQLYNWCTNCGNYGIHAAIKRALVMENISPKDVLLCFDIGCNGNGADKIRAYTYHGLHGRVIPFATGACLANRKVKVIAFGGDGGTLSEGLSHLIHAVRCNYDMTFVLHDNSNYGLTTGQASATTPQAVPMNTSPDGVTASTINPTELVLSLEPSFVARGFSGKVKELTEVLRKALNHKGFSYVEALQSCPTYNRTTPHEWYFQHTYDVESDPEYDRFNLEYAKKIAKDRKDKIAIGVLYQDMNKPDFLARQANRLNVQTELVSEVKNYPIETILQEYR
ncbi:2-oxoacid:ferredoxin oxidoreductase subunit beta [Candidatus Dojkabacteria bacterium]|nr:2-oxoacid:ferredoxin oxidoreductase subunit beta [Candidatus Dojkabacteria bacterium]